MIPFNNLKIKQRSNLSFLVPRGSDLVKDNNNGEENDCRWCWTLHLKARNLRNLYDTYLDTLYSIMRNENNLKLVYQTTNCICSRGTRTSRTQKSIDNREQTLLKTRYRISHNPYLMGTKYLRVKNRKQ